jgi:hypothetical protein
LPAACRVLRRGAWRARHSGEQRGLPDVAGRYRRRTTRRPTCSTTPPRRRESSTSPRDWPRSSCQRHPRELRCPWPNLDTVDPGNHASGQGRRLRRRHPLGRAGQPAELPPAYVFLASDDSTYITGERIGATGGPARARSSSAGSPATSRSPGHQAPNNAPRLRGRTTRTSPERPNSRLHPPPHPAPDLPLHRWSLLLGAPIG